MMVELKNYQKEDAAVICSWIKDETSLYQWSADKIETFPLRCHALNEAYAPMIRGGGFVPLSAFDENGTLVGHLCIRYPDANDDRTVRFGFVIVAPNIRGCGNGKKMLQVAIDYVENTLHASKITLGVFANNDRARYCYEAVGFRSVGKTEVYKMSIGEWECIEMEFDIV